MPKKKKAETAGDYVVYLIPGPIVEMEGIKFSPGIPQECPELMRETLENDVCYAFVASNKELEKKDMAKMLKDEKKEWKERRDAFRASKGRNGELPNAPPMPEQSTAEVPPNEESDDK